MASTLRVVGNSISSRACGQNGGGQAFFGTHGHRERLPLQTEIILGRFISNVDVGELEPDAPGLGRPLSFSIAVCNTVDLGMPEPALVGQASPWQSFRSSIMLSIFAEAVV